jgi:hypothetical protein
VRPFGIAGRNALRRRYGSEHSPSRRVLTTTSGVLFALALALAGPVQAERDRLYTAPDPAASGGIRGEITGPRKPVRQILAIPADDPELVYMAALSGSDGHTFTLTGLPMRKYDLFVIFDDAYYEGLVLSREEDTLTAEDRQKITTTITKAEPYFKVKTIHRLQGTTGRSQFARGVVSYLRDRESTNGSDLRRTVKLVTFKDVGPGWQVVRARDLYPTWTTPAHARPVHHYDERLGQIRVTDQMKDIGGLNLEIK